MADDTTTETTDDATTPDDTNTEDLGDAGKRAISAERARAKTAERATTAATRELQKAQVALEELRNAGASDAEKAIATARKEAAAEARRDALAEANSRLVRAEIRTAAAAAKADPDLVARLLDAGDFEVGEDGEVNPKLVRKAVDALIEDHPYLAASDDGKPRGSFDGGARRSAPGTEDMNDLIRRQVAGRM